MIKDELGQRMKKYESAEVGEALPRKVPVIIRLDGKAFHTFTKGFKKPFDDILINAMIKTTKYLCVHIQGCVFGYTQSDEISLVLIDYQSEDSDAWFGYRVQKMVSIAASMASVVFNDFYQEESKLAFTKLSIEASKTDNDKIINDLHEQMNFYMQARNRKAYFDARCFSLPKEEVCNYILWRQFDARRNSILSLGQVYFNQNKLNKKTCLDITEMLQKEKQVRWEDLATHYKFGTAFYLVKKECVNLKGQHYIRNILQTDLEFGMLIGENRLLLSQLVNGGEKIKDGN